MSNGSSVTLPALEFLGLPEHTTNGTNRLSVVSLGLVGFLVVVVVPSTVDLLMIDSAKY